MKKIMKKAFSLVLALVMVLSLAPMTALAADDPALKTDGSTEVLNLLDGAVWRDFDPTEDGTLTITLESVSGPAALTVMNWADYSQPIRAQVSTGQTYTLQYEAGGEYEFAFEMAAASADVCAVTYSVSLGSAEGSGSTGSTEGSTIGTAIDLTANKSINVPANGTSFYTVAMLDSSKTYNVTVTNSTVGPMAGAQQIGVTPYYNGAADGETQYGYGEVTAVVRPTMTGVIYFSVANVFEFGDLSATVTIAEVTESGEGNEGGSTPNPNPAGTYENPAEMEVGENTASVENYDTYWFTYTATTAGRLWVAVDEDAEGWYYDIYNGDSYVDCIFATDANAAEDIVVAAGDVIKLGFGHEDGTADVTFELEFEAGTFTKVPNGKENAPYVMIMGDNTVSVPAETAVWYTYVATENGTLTLTMKTDESTAGWFYDGYVNDYDYTYFPANPDTYMGPSSTDTDPASLRSVPVRAGDVVKFMVMTAWNEEFERPEGTVVFSAWFAAGEVAGSDEKSEKVVSDEVLVLGENTVELDPSAETTIFEFSPEEAGTYVITTNNGVVGYWGAGSFFVSDYTENKTATLEYNLENVGPSIMIGVTGEGEATVTIKKAGEAETKPTIPTIVYQNVIVPEYLDEFEIALPNQVDINDDVKDTAVLGADGFYHLNAADGPVLFVNFDNEIVSLIQAYGYGRLNGVITNADDEIIAIVDYNAAFLEYNEASNDDSCYPLTEDLITILKAVGENEAWYGEEGFVGGAYEDEAWMFACCYASATTSVDVELEEAEKEDTNVVIKDSGKLTADSLEAIIETSQGDKVVFTVEAGEEAVVFEFVTEDMELIDGKETYDFSVELVTDYADAAEDVADIEEAGFVLRVNFSYEGKLPATATISIPVGTDYAGDTLYYYEILADGTLKYVCDAPVDANGVAKVTQDHCSDYVLLSEKAADTPNTGDNANFVLWFAVLALGVVAIAGSVVMKKREF